jgi:23S rRNA (adenine2503-C2)-methyltransferase
MERQDNSRPPRYNPPMNQTSVYSYTRSEWESHFLKLGQSPNVLPFWMAGLYRDQKNWVGHVSKKLLENLKAQFDFSLPLLSDVKVSEDGTAKFLVRFPDGLEVETVLIPFHKRFTVCLSTQVGCAMSCSFCYTGTQGLKRNLSSGEIVAQYILASAWLKERNPGALNPSIVFMGQGEPLHNFAEVKRAIEILNDPEALGVGHRQMTLSTVGLLPGLKKIREDFPKINLALSLHSPFEDERNQLIPLNERYPLAEVVDVLDSICLLPRQFITYEYLLIGGFNMSERHGEALEKLLGKRRAILNLIPFNPFPGATWRRPTDEEVEAFKEELVKRKLRVLVRTTKGSDILAACGQLKVNRLGKTHAQRI